MPTPETTKFALRNFAGKPKKFFRVEKDDLSAQAAVAKKNPSHHIFVIDRSGSMTYDLPDLKTMVEKLLTLGEFDNASLKVSLVTYSSSGDVKLHFKGATVSDVMKANSPQLKEVLAIRATAMTCISQGLVMAETLIDDKETTCISLHTDGWANDRSPMAESAAIATVVASLKKHPNVFVNTIAYRDYCDFNLLSSISNGLSGACIQAKNVKQVYDALYGATALLAGSMSPALEAGIGEADYVAFASMAARKILGSEEGIVVRGLSEKDDRVAFRYYEIAEETYEKLKVPETVHSKSDVAILAYARTAISEGRLMDAKYAVVASKHGDLLKKHAKALVSSDVAAFASTIEEALVGGMKYDRTKDYGIPSKGASVLSVLSVLDRASSSLSVNLKTLLAGYKRRGVKRVPGTRGDDGSLTVPKFEQRYRNVGEEWVSVNKFEINRNNATINMLVSQEIDIFPTGGTSKVASVHGVDLSKLRSFNNYTLVGDGALNISQLIFRTTDKRCFRELKDLGVVTGEYKPNEAFVIDFSDLPLVAYETTFDAVQPDEVNNLAKLTVLSKILNGMFKGESASLTSEQIAKLKDHHLTPALNFSPPTTTEYADLATAIAEGKVDTRLSYKIDVGVPSLTSVSKLRSGNEYLQRRFTLEFLGKDVEKPTLDQITLGGKFGVKKLSAKTQLDEVDALSYPIYEGFLGTGSEDDLLKTMALIPDFDGKDFLKTVRGKDRDEAVAAVADASKAIEGVVESFYDRIRPLAFYVGATGLVPDSFDTIALTSEQFTTKYPEAKLTKAEKEEGTFFVLPNGLVLTVYVKSEHFSISAPVAA